MRFILAAASILATITVSPGANAEVFYSYSGPSFTQFSFDSPSNGLQLGPFTSAMHISGWFSTATALPADLPYSNINALVTGFSFNDGVNTLSFADFASFGCGAPNYACFNAQTDHSGKITGWVFNVVLLGVSQLALNQSSPVIFFENQATVDAGAIQTCTAVTAGQCTSIIQSYGSSGGRTAGEWTPASIAPVPEPSTWAMLLVGFLGIAFWASPQPRTRG